MTDLTCWLHKSFREKSNCEGESLCHGHQKDTYNCRIYISNTFEADIFNKPILLPQHGSRECLNWFLKFSGTSSSTSQISKLWETTWQGHRLGAWSQWAIQLVQCWHHTMFLPNIWPDMLNLLNPLTDEAFSQSTLDILEDFFSKSSIPSTASIDLSASEWDLETSWLDSEKSSVTKGDSGDDSLIFTQNGPQAAVKCKHSALEFNSQSSSSSEGSTHWHKVYLVPWTGISKSVWVSLKVCNVEWAGTSQVNNKLEEWKKSLQVTDGWVEFDKKTIRWVRHSECGIWVTVKECYMEYAPKGMHWNGQSHTYTIKGVVGSKKATAGTSGNFEALQSPSPPSCLIWQFPITCLSQFRV